MRLLDQVMQARLPVQVADASGHFRVPGAGAHAAQLLACPLRYVADERASDYCAELLATDRGMLVGENEFLRVGAPSFWLEWECPPCDDEAAGARSGLLVAADATGRAGSVTTFWEQRSGEPVVAQMQVEFDLDRDLRDAGPVGCCALPTGTHPLAPHLLLHFLPEWRGYFDRLEHGAGVAAAGVIASNILPGIEFLFAFSTLLAERTCLSGREVDMSRLNRHRDRKRQPALLDHIEVRLDLASAPASGGGALDTSREAARLHTVRGHLVSRGGQTFWRRSHLRGDPSRSIATRTVRVTRKVG